MSFELPFYIVLFLYTLRSCFYQEKENKDHINFLFVFAYVVVVRVTGFDIDFHTYIEALENQIGLMIANPYFAREWFYWIISSLIFDIVKNEYIVILVYDLLALSLVIGIRRKYKLPHYFVGLYFLFFPSVFGVQNIFRQHVMVALLGYSLIVNGKFKKLLVYGLAVFTHNSAIIFFPLLLLSSNFFKRSRRKSLLAFLASFLMIFISVPFFTDYKSSVRTGFELELVYAFCIGTIVLIYQYLQGTKLRGYEINNFLTAIYGLLVIVYSVVLFTSMQAERIGMIILLLLLPFFIKKVDTRVRQKIIVRLFICVFFTLPSLIFPNTVRFLTTGF